MRNAYTGFNTKSTPQNESIPGEKQILNNAGGYVYAVGAFKQLERFLLLGSEGGSYYVGEHKLTKENAINTIAAIESDGAKAVRTIVEISESGRAVKNDPAIFALALAASAKDAATRALALGSLSKVCRIPTHLFHFLTYVKQFRGFGRGLKRAVGDWYQNQEVDRLAYQVVKYQSRDGWSNADALRLSHPKADSDLRNVLYKWVVDGFSAAAELGQKSKEASVGDWVIPRIVAAFEDAKTADTQMLVQLIKTYNLSREMLPTEALKEPEVWEALLEKMPLTAMIRNLGNMSKCGLLKPLSDASRKVVNALGNREALKEALIHPINLLIALKTYSMGHGLKGSGQWDVVQPVVDALDDAFYLAFDFVEPTGKNLLLAIDVSGSMSAQIAGIPNMSAREGAAVMALACARTESEYGIVCFDTRVVASPQITKRMSLKDVARVIPGGGATDCAAPIRWATEKKIKADCIVILTDSETWAGQFGHPSQVVRDYRNKVNSNAKVVNVGMVATNCTINDPNDRNSLDVAGFDSSVPEVISNFIKE